MNKRYLEDKFNKAIENNCGVCIEVTIPGQSETEYIINKSSSLQNKLEYYLEAYDDLLVHKHNDQIIIVDIKLITGVNFQYL